MAGGCIIVWNADCLNIPECPQHPGAMNFEAVNFEREGSANESSLIVQWEQIPLESRGIDVDSKGESHMTGEGKIKLVRDKNQLLADFEKFNSLVQEYARYLKGTNEGDGWQKGALDLLRYQQLALHHARASLGSVDLVCALLRRVVSGLSLERFNFKGVSLPEAGEQPPGSAEAGDDVDNADLEQLIAWISAASRNAPLEFQRKLQRLLGDILAYFREVSAENVEGIEHAVAQINMSTTNRQTRMLIREIAVITRDIFNTLQTVSEGLPLDNLAESSGGISDAVKKLKGVLVRLDDAAEQNIANMEKVDDLARGETQSMTSVMEALRIAQNKMMLIKKEHPNLEDALTRIQDRLSDEVGSHTMDLKLKREMYSASHLELISNQSFQELTGKTLRKIINFVESMEKDMIELLKEYRPVFESRPGKTDDTQPIDPARESLKDGSDVKTTQDEVDKLLGELGF